MMNSKAVCQETVRQLKQAYDQAERDFVAAIILKKVAMVDEAEAMKEATRARMKYMRAMGAVGKAGAVN
jgi:hypothetical protein